MENSISDEEQLRELAESLDRHAYEVEFAEAQMVFCNLSARWECTREYAALRDLDVAESRLIQLFGEGDWHFSSTKQVMEGAWAAYKHFLLFHHERQS